jgi:UMF1 family MFS transporter
MQDSSSHRDSVSPRVTKLEIFGWCMYDVADSAFTTVIVTALYATYFSRIVVGDPQRADFLWALGASISEILVALLAPVLGAIADYSGSRKRFLGACAAVVVLFTGSLWFAGPGEALLGLTLFILANIGFAGGSVFIDSFLPGISTASSAARLSGTKWAMGYASGLICMALCLPLAKSVVANPTPEQLSTARFIPIVVAAWYAAAVIPTFLFLRDRSSRKALAPGDNYVRAGFRRLGHTLRNIRRYRELFKLLTAFLVYNDGVVTVIYFASLYAATTIGFSTAEIAAMFIVVNVVAAGGALSFGWLAGRIGKKRAVMISLGIWLSAVAVAYFSYSKAAFYVVAILAGIGMGSSQSVTRALVADFTPRENAAEFFGFLGIAGKALAFVGPILFGTISSVTGSQRPAVLAVGTFFVAGLLLLRRVDEAAGRASGRIAVDAV